MGDEDLEGEPANAEDRGTETMRAIARRLQRLEERLVPAVESWETRRLLARLEAARLRVDATPITPERRAELRGMTIPAILHSRRHPRAGRCRGAQGD
jgi:hypothetical protein